MDISAKQLVVSLLVVGYAGIAAADPRPDGREGREGRDGAVYTLSNDPDANAVAVFHRDRDGSLTEGALVATGGRGTGASLGSQGALALSHDGRWLFAVNAGSDDVTSFRVTDDGLARASTAPSGGAQPVSLAVHGHLLYVLNAAGAGSVSGLWVREDGTLTPIERSTRPLSGAAVTGAAEVAFDPSGSTLVVTEKATNVIDTYTVYRDGTLSAPRVTRSPGATPYGFAFDREGVFVVSEAAGGAASMGSASSYELRWRGDVEVLSPAVAEHQSAPCWVAIPRRGHVAYVANAASHNLSAYRIDPRGRITLVGDGVAADAGASAHPTDLAITPDDRLLYVLEGGGAVGAFRVGRDGALTPAGTFTGLPAHAVGIAVR